VVLLGTAWGTHENLCNKLGTSLGTIGGSKLRTWWEHQNPKQILGLWGLWDKVWCCWERSLGNAWKLGEQNGSVIGNCCECGGNTLRTWWEHQILSPPLGSNDTYFNTCLLTPCHGFGHAEPTRVFDPHNGDTN
jgi:hypothetical protein